MSKEQKHIYRKRINIEKNTCVSKLPKLALKAILKVDILLKIKVWYNYNSEHLVEFPNPEFNDLTNYQLISYKLQKYTLIRNIPKSLLFIAHTFTIKVLSFMFLTNTPRLFTS